MQSRLQIMIKTLLLGAWLLPVGLAQAATTLPTVANLIETHDSLAEASKYLLTAATPGVGQGAIDSREVHDADDNPLPMPLPGLLMLAATGLAYVWQSKPVPRTRRKPTAASMA
jgi:hypothetical protein